MTSRHLLFTILFFAGVFSSYAQAVGKLEIKADLSAIAAYDPTIEVSVINMSTNKEMIRKKVNEEFDFAFPLNGRYLLYFKKDGYNTTRIILDTRTFMSGVYTIKFDLGLDKNVQGGDLAAIPIGTIKFDKATTNFGYKASGLLATQSVKVISSIRESEVVRF